MKQALIIVNALLVIAVSYLLYKQFTTNSSTEVSAGALLEKKDSVANKKMLFAYMNMDSIQNKYELAKKVLNEVDKRKEGLDAELNRMQRAYQTKLEGYQKRGATMTEEQASAAQQDMQKTERELYEKGESLREDFGRWVSSKNLSLIKSIQDYLKKFNADGTYSFIFSHEPFFYYADSTYDITNDVLKGLNQEYKEEKKK